MDNSILSWTSPRDFQVIRPTQKQFSNHHLLHTVKQVNGEMAYRQAYQKSIVVKFNQRSTVPEQYSNSHFCYILQGEVYVYKVLENKPEPLMHSQQIKNRKANIGKGIFITCHKSHQIFGLQQYPINIYEKLVFQAIQTTKIIVFPIQLSLTSFRKIFNMSLVQYRAQLLKKCYFFKELQIQKLKKIALYSKRYQGKKGQTLCKEGSLLNYLPLIISGEIMVVQKGDCKQIFGKDKIVGLDQSLDDSQTKSRFDLVFLTDSQIILIPKAHIMKVYKIKYRLEDKQSINPKSMRPTQYEVQKAKSKEKIQECQIKEKPANQLKSFVFDSAQIQQRNNKSIKHRPNTTSAQRNKSQFINQMKYQTFYNKKPASNIRQRVKTQISQFNPFPNSAHSEQSQTFTTNLAQNISLGQLCLRKFLHRKQRRQNCQIMKYLRSNAPELKLNPSKQYALVKPLHVSDSSYVKNMKRKLKKSYIKTGLLKQRQQKKKQARFSFFFKQEGQV